MKNKNLVKALSLVFAFALVVALGFVLKAPAAAEGNTLELYLNTSFTGTRDTSAADYGRSADNPYSTLSEIYGKTITFAAPFTKVNGVMPYDKVIVHITGDSLNNSSSADGNNATLGGYGSAYQRFPAQQGRTNDAFGANNASVSADGLLAENSKVLLVLQGEQIGTDPDTGKPIYPNLYYSTSGTAFYLNGDFEIKNLTIRHQPTTAVNSFITAARTANTDTSTLELRLCGDRIKLGENVQFYGWNKTTGDSTAVTIVGSMATQTNKNRYNIPNLATATGAVTQASVDEMTVTTAKITDRYEYTRGRDIEILSGDYTGGIIYMLGNGRHVYTEGTSITARVENVTAKSIYLYYGGGEFIHGATEAERIPITFTIKNTTTQADSSNGDAGRLGIAISPNASRFKTANGVQTLCKDQSHPFFDLTVNFQSGNNIGDNAVHADSGMYFGAPFQTTDVTISGTGEVLVDRTIHWTGNFTMNYDTTSNAANGLEYRNASSASYLRSNGGTNHRVFYKGKRTINVTGGRTIDGLTYALTNGGFEFEDGSSFEFNVYDATFGTTASASAKNGLAAISTTHTTKGTNQIPVAVNVYGGTVSALLGICDRASSYTTAYGDITLTVGTHPNYNHPVVGDVFGLNQGYGFSTTTWKEANVPVDSITIKLLDGTGLDGETAKVSSRIYGVGANADGRVTKLSMILGEKNSNRAKAVLPANVNASSCWAGSTGSYGEIEVEFNGVSKTGTAATVVHNNVNGVAKADSVKVTVNGGSFTTNFICVGTTQKNTAANCYIAGSVTFIINGNATFSGWVAPIGAQIKCDSVDFTVNSATFNSGVSLVHMGLGAADVAAHAATITGKAKIDFKGGSFNTNNPFYVENASSTTGTTSTGNYNEVEVNIASAVTLGNTATGTSAVLCGLRGHNSVCKKLTFNINGTYASGVAATGNNGLLVAPVYLGSGVVIDEMNIHLGENTMVYRVDGVQSGANQTIKALNITMDEGSAVRDINLIQNNLTNPRLDNCTINCDGNVNVAFFGIREKYDETLDTNGAVHMTDLTVNVGETGRIPQFFLNYTDTVGTYRPDANTIFDTITINNEGTFGGFQPIQNCDVSIGTFNLNQKDGTFSGTVRFIQGHGSIGTINANLSGGAVTGLFTATYGDYGHVNNFNLTVSGDVVMTNTSTICVRLCAASQIATNSGVTKGSETRASIGNAVIKLLGGTAPLITGAWYENSFIDTIKCYVDGGTFSNIYLAGYGGTVGTSELYLISGQCRTTSPNLTPGHVTFDANGIGADEVRGVLTNSRLYLLGDITGMGAGLQSNKSASLVIGGYSSDVAGESLFWTNGGTARTILSGTKYNTHAATTSGSMHLVFSDEDKYLADLDKTITATGTLNIVNSRIEVRSEHLAANGTLITDIADGFDFVITQGNDLNDSGEVTGIATTQIVLEGTVNGTVTADFTLDPSKKQQDYVVVPTGTDVDLTSNIGILYLTETSDGLDHYGLGILQIAGRTLVFDSTFEVRYLINKRVYDTYVAKGFQFSSLTVSVGGAAARDYSAALTGTPFVTDGTEYYWLKVTGIAPKDIGTEITLTLTGTLNGAAVTDTYTDSIEAALQQVAAGTDADFALAAQATLEYCQAAADRFGVEAEYWTDTENTVADFTGYTANTNYFSGDTENPIRIHGTSLILKDQLAIKFWANRGSYTGTLEGLTVRINGEDVTSSVVKEQNAGSAEYWTFTVAVPIDEMEQRLAVELFADGVSVSNTYTDSVLNYAVCAMDEASGVASTESVVAQAIINYVYYVNQYLAN